MDEPILFLQCPQRQEDGTWCRGTIIGIDYDQGVAVCREHLEAYLRQVEAR